MTDDEFRWNVERDGQTARIELAGEFDLRAYEPMSALFDMIQSDGIGHVQVDLGGVTFLDSTALGVILAADQRARRKGERLTLTRASDRVQRVLDIAGLSDHFEFEEPRPTQRAGGAAELL